MTDTERDQAEAEAEARQAYADDAGLRDRFKTLDRADAVARHKIGRAGERAASWALRAGSPLYIGALDKPDLELDRVGKVDVRTRLFQGEHRSDLTVRGGDFPKGLDRPFVLVWASHPYYRLRGWLYGREAAVDAYRHRGPYGAREPIWYVPPSALHSMEELLALGLTTPQPGLDPMAAPRALHA